MSEQLTTEQLIDRFAQTQGVSKEEAEKLVGAETTEEILDNIKNFTQSKINEVLRPKNRAQRRAAAKSMGRKKREKMRAISGTAEKLDYIDLIQKLRKLNEQRARERDLEEEEDYEAATEDN